MTSAQVTAGSKAGPKTRTRAAVCGVAAVLSVALLTALAFAGGTAHATNPGTNGKLGCEGNRGLIPSPNPLGISRSEVFTIDAAGTNETVLTDNLVRDGDPSFSPDGKFIAFENFASGSSEAYRMRADGTEVTRLTFNGFNADGTSREDRGTNWSPDGKQIVFHSTRDRETIPAPGSPFEVYIMNSDGSNQVRLTNNAFQDTLPAFSPDGKQIAFLSTRDGDFELYKMNVDGTNVERLTNSIGEDSQPTWSPDGKQIAFHTRRDNPPGQTANVEIYKMNADGSNPTRLTTTPTVAEIFPVWSPDGTRIAFDTFADVFTIRAADGGDLQQVTTTPTVTDTRCDWQSIPRPGPAVPAPRPAAPPAAPAAPSPRAATPFAGCPASSVNAVAATAGNDTLTGTAVGDRIFAGAGDDTVDGLAGADCLDLGAGVDRGQGGSGNDLVLGGLGNDALGGGAGNDKLRGGSGGDSISGGSGGDSISGGSGGDSISGGSGADRISARDRRQDTITCGTGRDSVTADRVDRVSRDCERVKRR